MTEVNKRFVQGVTGSGCNSCRTPQTTQCAAAIGAVYSGNSVVDGDVFLDTAAKLLALSVAIALAIGPALLQR